MDYRLLPLRDARLPMPPEMIPACGMADLLSPSTVLLNRFNIVIES
jgi:hypothetical protein